MAAADIFCTGTLNSNQLGASLKSYSCMEDFLSAEDLRLVFQSSLVDQPESIFQYDFDIDGLVVEFIKVTAIKQGLHSLFLPLSEERNAVEPHYLVLKKHIPLREYSDEGLKAVRNCVGMKLAHVDGGCHLISEPGKKDFNHSGHVYQPPPMTFILPCCQKAATVQSLYVSFEIK